MTRGQAIGFPALCALLAACASSQTYTRAGVAPRFGPDVSVYAEYSGGLSKRDLRARFKVDEDAYVLVGHLGGDGIIRVLYPESPKAHAKVKKNDWQRSHSVLALYDAVPSLYSAVPEAYRFGAARVDSYDGRGNGFIFVIASREELRWDAIGDGIDFTEMEVPDYARLNDPRLAIREYADLVAGQADYTLEFAMSFHTVAFTSYADNVMDCYALTSLSYMALHILNTTNLSGYTSGFGYAPRCSSSYFAFYPLGLFSGSSNPVTSFTPTPVQPSTRITRMRPRLDPRTRTEARPQVAARATDFTYPRLPTPRERAIQERARREEPISRTTEARDHADRSRPASGREETYRPVERPQPTVERTPTFAPVSAPAPVERAAPAAQPSSAPPHPKPERPPV